MVLLSSGLTINSAVHGPEQINAYDEGLCHFIRKWMTRGGGDTLFLMMIIFCAGVYILRLKSTNSSPPLFPVLQTSPKHTFLQKFSAVFRAFRGKFKELGCKIYTPYGFLMLI